MATQFVTLGVEVEPLALDVAQVGHTLDVGPLQLDIDTPFAQARDRTLELLAQVLLHKLDHLVFDRSTLGISGQNLPLGGVFAQGLQLPLIGRGAPLEVVRQKAMHQHIGVAADGGGEVGIVGEGQTVMAQIVGRIDRLGHRAYGHRREGIALGFALDAVEQFVQLLGDGTPLRGTEDVAETKGELTETIQLVGRGDIVHTIDHRTRNLAPLLAHTVGAELGHTAVGQEHKLLDELVGLLLHLEIDLDGATRLVELEAHLLALEGNRSVLEALAT